MRYLILILFLFTLVTCSTSDEEVFEKSFEYTTIAKGETLPQYSGLPKYSRSNLVIKDSKSREIFLNTISTEYSKELFEALKVGIDFSHYQLLIVIDNIQSTGGHSIDIISITEHNNEKVVVVDKLHTGNLSTVITQPFQIVKIPKSNKRIHFINQYEL